MPFMPWEIAKDVSNKLYEGLTEGARKVGKVSSKDLKTLGFLPKDAPDFETPGASDVLSGAAKLATGAAAGLVRGGVEMAGTPLVAASRLIKGKPQETTKERFSRVGRGVKEGAEFGATVGKAGGEAAIPAITAGRILGPVPSLVWGGALAEEGGKEAYQGFKEGNAEKIASGAGKAAVGVSSLFGGAKDIGRAAKTPGLLPKARALVIGQPFGGKVGGKITDKPQPKLSTKADKVSIHEGDPVTAASKAPDLLHPKEPKERGFIASVKTKPGAVPEVRSKVQGEYNPIANQATLNRARKAIDKNPQGVLSEVLDPRREATADSFAKGMLLIDDLQKRGDFDGAVSVAESIAKKATTQGQSIQALSMWGRLTPAGALRQTQSMLNDATKAGNLKKPLTLSPKSAQEIADLAKRANSLPPGTREQQVAAARLFDKMSEQVPVNFWQKVDTLHTFSLLVNPKTAIRNIFGNTLFGVAENVSDVVGTGVDKAVSLITGQRTRTLPSIRAQMKGGMQGLKLGLEDAMLGIDTSATAGKYMMPKTFRKGPGALAEKALNIELRVPDRFASEAAKAGEFANQLKVSQINKGKVVKDWVKEPIAPEQMATYTSLRRTFQDDSMLANALSGIKRNLNVHKKFGFGSIILKFPKVPGNIVTRAGEYTPLGTARALIEAAKPAFGQKFDQRVFVDALSQSLVGTSAIVAGYMLAKEGLLHGTKDENKTVAILERDLGFGEFKLNLSGLKRWVLSGFNSEEAKPRTGDTTVSYDWAQPMSIPVTIGANIQDQNEEYRKTKPTVEGAISRASSVIEPFATGADVIVEQPLFTGLKQFFTSLSYGNLFYALSKSGQRALSSFVPSVVNQARQFVDNTMRETYDPSYLQEMFNLTKNRIPGVSESLPPRRDVFGEEKELYQDNTNTIFNVFFNPAFVNRVKEDPEARHLLELIEYTGETVRPGTDPTKLREQKLFGYEIVPTPEAIDKQIQYVGVRSKKFLQDLMADQNFNEMSEDEQVAILQKGFSKISSEGRLQMFLDGRNLHLPPNVTPSDAFALYDRMDGKGAYKALDQEQKIEAFRLAADELELARSRPDLSEGYLDVVGDLMSFESKYDFLGENFTPTPEQFSNEVKYVASGAESYIEALKTEPTFINASPEEQTKMMNKGLALLGEQARFQTHMNMNGVTIPDVPTSEAYKAYRKLVGKKAFKSLPTLEAKLAAIQEVLNELHIALNTSTTP